MWLELATLLELSALWSWPAVTPGVLLQPRSWSMRARESRQRSGLLPTSRRFWLGLFASVEPCLSDAGSSSLSMLRLNSCSFSDDASFSLHRKETCMYSISFMNLKVKLVDSKPFHNRSSSYCCTTFKEFEVTSTMKHRCFFPKVALTTGALPLHC